jgi:hypothetical protein
MQAGVGLGLGLAGDSRQDSQARVNTHPCLPKKIYVSLSDWNQGIYSGYIRVEP